jgi:hypothetical protein
MEIVNKLKAFLAELAEKDKIFLFLEAVIQEFLRAEPALE